MGNAHHTHGYIRRYKKRFHIKQLIGKICDFDDFTYMELAAGIINNYYNTLQDIFSEIYFLFSSLLI